MSFGSFVRKHVSFYSIVRKRECARPVRLGMSGKSLSVKSVESGLLELRKNVKLPCSTIRKTPSAVNFSFSIVDSVCMSYGVSCLITFAIFRCISVALSVTFPGDVVPSCGRFQSVREVLNQSVVVHLPRH